MSVNPRAIPFNIYMDEYDLPNARTFEGESLADALKEKGYEAGDRAVLVSWEWLTTVCAGLGALKEKTR